MPIYGYVCRQCGHEFEVLQGINDAPLKSCPECMGPLQKLLYPVGVIFKGSGFYTTDYRASKDASNGKDAAEGAGDAKPKGETKATHLARAEAYRQQILLRQAEAEYRAALKIAPNDVTTRLALADTLYRQHRYDESIDILKLNL